MANLKQLRRRIVGIRNTQQLTRAMKLVAAAKLKRAQENVASIRPYAAGIEELLGRFASFSGDSMHPLLEQRQPRTARVLVFTSDKGLCGTFNSNVARAVDHYVRTRTDAFEKIDLVVLGRKGCDFLERRGIKIFQRHPGSANLTPAFSLKLARDLEASFVNREMDALFLIYNEFRSAMVQKVRWKQLLPIAPPAGAQTGELDRFLLEPGGPDILARLLPMYLHVLLRSAMLESLASELGARMTAMDSATKNASDMIDRLTLAANKARQEAITKELIDIVGGAEALK